MFIKPAGFISPITGGKKGDSEVRECGGLGLETFLAWTLQLWV